MLSVHSLSDHELRRNLQNLGVKVGPVIESTRRIYENRLLQLSAANNMIENEGNSSTSLRPPIKTEEPWAAQHSPFSHNSGDAMGNEPFGILGQQVHKESRPWTSTHDTPPHKSLQNSSMSFNRSTSPTSAGQDLTGHSFQSPSSSRCILEAEKQLEPDEHSFSRKNTSPQPPPLYSTPEGASIGRFSIFSKYLQADSSSPSSAPSIYSKFTSWLSSSPMYSQTLSPPSLSTRSSHLAPPPFFGNDFKISSIYKLLGVSTMDRHIPNMILFSGILLLTILASSYLLLNDRHGSISRISDFQSLVCPSALMESSDFHSCVHESDLPAVLNVLKILFEILSRYSGEHLCGQSAASPRMELNTAKHLVLNHLSSQSGYKISKVTPRVWDSALLLIQHLGRKHFGIAAYSLDGDFVDDIRAISEIEGMKPYIPGKCRIQRLLSSLLSFLVTMLWVSVLILFLGSAGYGVYRLLLFKKRRDERGQAELREVVQHLISLLHQQLKRHLRNPIEPPFIPALRIKETLAHSFNDINSIWPSVENYIHRFESDVLVQEWRGLGETWQWHGGNIIHELRSLAPRQSCDPIHSHLSPTPGVFSQSPKYPTVPISLSDDNVICSAPDNWYWRWGYSLNYSPQ